MYTYYKCKMRGWDKVLAVQFSVLQLCCKFQAVCVSLAVKKKTKKKKREKSFCLYSSVTKLQNPPTLHFRLFQSSFLWLRLAPFEKLVAAVFYVDPWAVPVYTYSIQSYCSDKQRRAIKVFIRTCRLILAGAGFQSGVESCHSPRQLPSYSRL